MWQNTWQNVSDLHCSAGKSHFNKFIRCCRFKKLNGFDVRSIHFSTWYLSLMKITLHPLKSLIEPHCYGFSHVALKLCSCFRSLDPDVTMRLTQLAHPVQRFLMPTWDLHLVILSSLQPLFMFETDNIIPLMADTHSTISTVFGLRHEMLDHMTCMYSVWISSTEGFFSSCL